MAWTVTGTPQPVAATAAKREDLPVAPQPIKGVQSPEDFVLEHRLTTSPFQPTAAVTPDEPEAA